MKAVAKFLVCVLISAAASELAVEIYVRWYVMRGGGPRAAYADDYAMALDTVIIQVLVFVILLAICYVVLRTWRGRRSSN